MLDPNYPTAHLYYGNYWIQAGGRPDLGVYENKKALELDPLSSNINYVLGRNYYFANKLDSAYMQLKKTLILYPQNNLAKATLAHVLLAKKNFSEAFELIRQLPKTGPANLLEYQGAFLSYAYAVSGDTTRAKLELEKTLNENPDQLSYYLAHVYTILKDYGKALGHLDKAYKLRELSMVFLKVDPVLAPLRNEPRFIAFLKNMNLD